MPLPFTFLSGTVASSAEVNANFEYIMSFFGDATSPEEFFPKGTFRTGNMGQMSGYDNNFVHLGWNVEQYKSGNSVAVRRFENGKMATLLRIGHNGFQVLTANQTSGTLAPQLTETFRVGMTKSLNFVYVNQNAPIVGNLADLTKLQNLRLTYVAFDDPKVVMEGKWQGAGSEQIDVTKYGVPRHAKAVEFMVYATATANSGAAYKLMRMEAKPHQKTGFITHAYGGNAAYFGRTSNQGKVLVGTGSYAGKVRAERTAAFDTVSVYVQGYYI